MTTTLITRARIGQWGYYYSSKGSESPKHGKPCKVVECSPNMHVEFKDKRFGVDAVNLGCFVPDNGAQDA